MIFSEAVLGLSQGSVSELISKSKPWYMLSIKGREPFIRMQLWLSGQDNCRDTSSNNTSEYYKSIASSPPNAAKKQRVLFLEEQKEALRLAFALDPYPSVATIEFLGSELGLASRTITNWFHNHRMRLKKQSPHGNDPQMNRPDSQQSQGGGFNPVQFRLLLSQRLGFSALFSASPYFPPNPELTALMSRNMLPTSEQLSGPDLSLKQGDMSDDDDDDDDMDHDGSHLGSDKSADEGVGMPEVTPSIIEGSRSSRRKLAAPQWVNPDWQEESEEIINGVCVMQTDEFPSTNCQQRDAETVHIEPKPASEDHDSADEGDEPIEDEPMEKLAELQEDRPASKEPDAVYSQSEDSDDAASDSAIKKEKWDDGY